MLSSFLGTKLVSAALLDKGAVLGDIMGVLTACPAPRKRQNNGSPCPGELLNIA